MNPHFSASDLIFRPKYMIFAAAEATGVAAALSQANLNGIATAIVSVATVLVLGFLWLRRQVREDNRRWEAENRDSLQGQIDARDRQIHSLMAALEKQSEENRALQDHMEARERALQVLIDSIARERVSIHDQRTADHQRGLQYQEDAKANREKLAETTAELVEATRKLTETTAELAKARVEVSAARGELEIANRKIEELTAQVERVGRNAEHAATRAEANAGRLDRAEADIRSARRGE